MKRTILLLASLSACAVDGDELADESTEEQAVSSTAMQIHQCSYYDEECFISLPSSQCVIAGITGGLGAGSGVRMAKIFGSTLHIKRPSGGLPIVVKTACFSGLPGATPPVSWHSSDPPKLIAGGANSGRRCFLTGITANYGAFKTWETYVQVKRSGDDHIIEGNGSLMAADVRCFDVDEIGTFAIGNGSNATYNGDLAANGRAGGVACGLTGIGGVIDFTNRGVMIEYSSWQWSWWMTGWTGGNALCFQ